MTKSPRRLTWHLNNFWKTISFFIFSQDSELLIIYVTLSFSLQCHAILSTVRYFEPYKIKAPTSSESAHALSSHNVNVNKTRNIIFAYKQRINQITTLICGYFLQLEIWEQRLEAFRSFPHLLVFLWDKTPSLWDRMPILATLYDGMSILILFTTKLWFLFDRSLNFRLVLLLLFVDCLSMLTFWLYLIITTIALLFDYFNPHYWVFLLHYHKIRFAWYLH